MYGWIQFVKCTSSDTSLSDDGEPTGIQEGCSDSDWQLDAVPLFEDLNTPFVYFGSDSPTRIGKPNVNWRAQSYLKHVPDALLTRQVTPIMGFVWGFDVAIGTKSIVPLEELELKTSWNGRIGALQQNFFKLDICFGVMTVTKRYSTRCVHNEYTTCALEH